MWQEYLKLVVPENVGLYNGVRLILLRMFCKLTLYPVMVITSQFYWFVCVHGVLGVIMGFQ